MNEQDFRDALRQTMAVSTAPPPMSDDNVLDAARRDRKRRRAMWAGGGSAAAVVAVAVGVVFLASPGSGGGVGVGGQPPQVQSTDQAQPPNTEKTEPSLPGEQTDRTPASGPQHDKGVALAEALDGVIPAGYASPDDPELKTNQANYDDTVNGTELWTYSAIAPVTKDGGTGRLIAEVVTPRPDFTGEGCALTAQFWGMKGDCVEVVVDGRKVAVVTPTGDDRVAQWAGFRHDDGTVVFIAQSVDYNGTPPLAAPPLTADQLAALAVDPRFNLD
jgi:hypothetical protein